jgi:hypothetical protein
MSLVLDMDHKDIALGGYEEIKLVLIARRLLRDMLLTEDEDVREIATAQVKRFERWASRFQIDRSSSDYALRYNTAFRAIVEGSLEILCRQALSGMMS